MSQHRHHERVSSAVTDKSIDPDLETAAERERGVKDLVFAEREEQDPNPDPQCGECRDGPNVAVIEFGMPPLLSYCPQAPPSSCVYRSRARYTARHPRLLEGAERGVGIVDQADADLPHEHRPQLRRSAARARFPAAHCQSQGGHAGELEQGDDVIIPPAISNEEAQKCSPGGWKTLKPYLRVVAEPK